MLLFVLTCAEETLNFLVIGDWGGLPVEPYTTEVEKAIAREMGKFATANDVQFLLALGDNFYFDGVKSVEDPRFQVRRTHVIRVQCECCSTSVTCKVDIKMLCYRIPLTCIRTSEARLMHIRMMYSDTMKRITCRGCTVDGVLRSVCLLRTICDSLHDSCDPDSSIHWQYELSPFSIR